MIANYVRQGIAWAIQEVENFDKDKVITLDVGNAGVASALRYVLEHAPAWLVGLAGGKDKIVQKIVAFLTDHGIVLDKDGEDFHREPVQVTGMDALLDRFQQRLAAAAEMPVTLLMGRSPAGLNATGESDLAQWNMSVQASQRKVARPAIARMLEILTAGKFDGEICFAPLEDVDEKKAADTEKVKADTWKVYVDMGALHAEQVAMAEFADEPIEIDIAAMKKAIAAEQEMALNPPPPMPPVMPPAPAPAAPPAPSPAPTIRGNGSAITFGATATAVSARIPPKNERRDTSITISCKPGW
jgi:hypothetical protein